jgi:hypothetical protein
MRLNKSELARAFSVSTNTISNWIMRGCPHRSSRVPGVPLIFEWAKVEVWAYMYKTWPNYGDPDDVIGAARQRAKKIVAARRKTPRR